MNNINLVLCVMSLLVHGLEVALQVQLHLLAGAELPDRVAVALALPTQLRLQLPQDGLLLLHLRPAREGMRDEIVI